MNANQIINKTKYGLLFYCDSCNLIHLEFKNLNFNFSNSQLKKFTSYIHKLDAQEWEEINKDSPFRRKIVVPISHDSFNFLLNSEELNELKSLTKNIQINSLKSKFLKEINHLNRAN